MIELVLCCRDGKGELTGQRVARSFDNGQSAYVWYNQQRGHNVDRELDAATKNIPIIDHRG